MKIYTAEQINKAYEELSPSTQEVLFSPTIETQVQKTGVAVTIITGGIKMLTDLTNLTLLRLLDEKEFAGELVAQLKIDYIVAQKITSDVFSQIIGPIREKERRAAIKSVESDNLGNTAIDTREAIEGMEETPHAQTPDLAPDNLPTEETAESFLPKLTPKMIMPSLANQEQEAVHPFEEKMKEFFTAGQKPVDTVVPEVAPEPVVPPTFITPETIIPQKYVTPAPSASPASHRDPYREAIE